MTQAASSRAAARDSIDDTSVGGYLSAGLDASLSDSIIAGLWGRIRTGSDLEGGRPGDRGELDSTTGALGVRLGVSR